MLKKLFTFRRNIVPTQNLLIIIILYEYIGVQFYQKAFRAITTKNN